MKKKLILLLLFLSILLIVFVSCTGIKKAPKEYIKQNFGDEVHTISFSTSDNSIADIKYTLNNVPDLPIPKKPGYMFKGWYLDKNATKQFSKEYLIMNLGDVVLYPKFEKDVMIQDGVYDIDFESYIDGEIKYGPTSKGYRDLSEHIIREETFIEKVNNRTLLKLTYDEEIIIKFMQTPSEVYKISIDSSLASKVREVDVISNLTTTYKSIFYDITDLDLDKPIIFNIQNNDFFSKGAEPEKSTSRNFYNLKFNIKNVIGLRTAFVNGEKKLFDGLYRAKCFVRQINQKESIMASFDQVYVDIVVKDGQYTLIKKITPYYGLAMKDNSNQDAIQYYDNRLMTFISPFSYATIEDLYDPKTVDGLNSYYPGLYKANKIGELTHELRKENNETYVIINLGDKIRNFICYYTLTGFMEVVSGAGTGAQLNLIDTSSIEEVNQLEYNKIEEKESFKFKKNINLVYSSLAKIKDDSKRYEYAIKYPTINFIPNYFYTINNKGIKIYNHKIVYKALNEERPLRELDKKIVSIEMNIEVFGYNPKKDGQLFADVMEIEIFAGGSSGLRNKKFKVEIGHACETSEKLNVYQLYKEKIDSKPNFSNISYVIRKDDLNGDIVNNSLDINYSEPLCIEFTDNSDKKIVHSYIMLTNKESIKYNLKNKDGSVFDLNNEYEIGTYILAPKFSYSIGSFHDSYYKNYYNSESKKTYAHPLRCLYSYYNDENASTSISSMSKDQEFITVKSDLVLIYEIFNKYGKREIISIPIKVKGSNSYIIKDELNNVLSSRQIKYKSNEIFVNERLSYDASSKSPNSAFEKYIFVHGYENFDLKYTSAKFLYRDKETLEINSSDVSFSQLKSKISNGLNDPGLITIEITYSYNDNITFKVSYLTRMSYSGTKKIKIFNKEVYYTNHYYNLDSSYLYGEDGKKFGVVRPDYIIYRKESNQLIKNSEGKEIVFDYPGEYRICYVVAIFRTDTDFVYYDKRYREYGLYEDIIVEDLNNTDIEITYHSELPFKDGQYIKKVNYNKVDNILMLSGKSINSGSSRFLGWAISNNFTYQHYSSLIYGDVLYKNFINDYSSKKVDLYAVFDHGVMVTIDVPEDKILSNGYEKEKRIYADYLDSYEIDFSKYMPKDNNTYLKDGYYFYGWKCLSDGKEIFIPAKLDPHHSVYKFNSNINLTLDIRKKITVKYNIDQKYSKTKIDSVYIFEGESINKPEVNIISIDSKKEFSHWSLNKDGSPYDFNNVVGDNDLTLYAVFKDKI